MKQKISSEFVNRIDEIVLFNPLPKEIIRQIALLQIAKLKDRLSKNSIDIFVDDQAVNHLVEIGFEPGMGARPVKRVIDRFLVDGLAQSMLENRIDSKAQVMISLANNHLIFSYNP